MVNSSRQMLPDAIGCYHQAAFERVASSGLHNLKVQEAHDADVVSRLSFVIAI
jgi:hypothetical protein